jgi:hypothetical protein
VGGAGLTFSYDDLGAEPLGPDDPRYLGPIALRAVLGSGGMGRVYLGITPTGYAAVKRVLPQLATDKDFIRRFRQELDNQARLPDGVGARVLAADHEAKPPWFAAEYVPGVTVHEAVELAGGRLPAQACWVLAREFAARLAAMAELGIIHRDLKPSNINAHRRWHQADRLRSRPRGRPERGHGHRKCGGHAFFHGARAGQRQQVADTGR